MTKRSNHPTPCRRMARNLPIVAAVAVTLLGHPLHAMGEVLQPGPPVQTASVDPVERVSLGAYLRLPVTYTLLRGSEFDGRHAGVLDANRTVYLPKISGGFGFKPSAGLKINHVAPYLSLMTGAAFAFSRHQAISYSAGNSYYDRPDTTLYQMELELRAIADLGRFRPFLGVNPGYVMLSLPNGITSLDARRVVSWSDVTLRGVSMETSLGVLFQIIAPVAVDASLAYRIQQLTSSSSGSFGGFGLSPGWAASLGVVTSVE